MSGFNLKIQLIGGRTLDRKLKEIEKSLAKKALRNALYSATHDTMNKMVSKAPRGLFPHRTYERKLVSGGYLRKNIIRKSFIDKRTGIAGVALGAKYDAYYGINFIDRGPWTVTSRRYNTGQYRRGRGVRREVKIKPYVIKEKKWFVSTFITDRGLMEKNLIKFLRTEIEKAAKK